jgi:hypothetical protein
MNQTKISRFREGGGNNMLRAKEIQTFYNRHGKETMPISTKPQIKEKKLE